MKITDLSSTSALVLLWEGGAVHTSSASQEFRGLLDVSTGRELLRQCNAAWPHYYEIVRNRKYCILSLAKKLLKNRTSQAVILGAGFDTLSLELASSTSATIFDVDIAGMDAKSDIIRSTNPALFDRVQCVTADMSNAKMLAERLSDAGWSKAQSLIIIEGLSYYVSSADLWRIMRSLKSNIKTHLILEYLLPIEQIPEADRHASEGAFDIICKKFSLPELTRYDYNDIKNHVTELGGTIHDKYNMTRMEKERIGANSLCSFNRNNWIEICHISL